ncbi:MAG: heavy metal transporter [Dethiosulfovibrio peptidovorans]|nr:MAG: heavy metal transporter [Dethiosulfovibrio peptidovorans]
MMTYTLSVPDMSCSHCEARITRILQDLGVPDFSVDLQARTVTVKAESLAAVLTALDDGGYEAREVGA